MRYCTWINRHLLRKSISEALTRRDKSQSAARQQMRVIGGSGIPKRNCVTYLGRLLHAVNGVEQDREQRAEK
jgi:hypothetical protein